METTELLDAFFRLIHVVVGILWIGLLYFFNFVNGPFAATMDAETKKKVVPELMPRTLFFFRMGAAATWITGVILLMLVFYHQKAALAGSDWTTGAVIMIIVAFGAMHVYDALAKAVTNPRVVALAGFLLITLAVWMFQYFGGYSYRGYVMHTGVMFGTIMAFNVWFRIWPAQRQIITAVKAGQAPDAKLVAMAGLRSRHNTFLSVPLVWTMLNAHTTFLTPHWWTVPVVVALGWMIVAQIYKVAGKVKGF